MTDVAPSTDPHDAAIAAALQQVFGLGSLRPLQRQAIDAAARNTATAAAMSDGPELAPAALVGFVCAAVSHAVRRVHSVLPAISAIKGQLSSAAASLLVPGVVAYGRRPARSFAYGRAGG